jgi:Flp pilus assembly protein TadD
MKDVDATLERPPYDPTLTTKIIAFWRRRTDRDPKIALGWTQLAGAYLARHQQTGELEEAREAEKAARRAIELHPDPGTMIVLGRALLSQHRFPEALEVAERAARADRAASGLLVDVLIELGELVRAQAIGKGLSISDPLDRLALEARLLEAQGDDEELLSRLRGLRNHARRMPQIPAGLAAWYHVRLGHALIDRGKLDEGRACCQEALGLVPGEHAALVGLAEAACLQGQWSEGLRLAEEACRSAPADFEAIHLKAKALRKLGRTGEADQEFTRLRALVQRSPRIYDRLYARVCVEENKDLEEALLRAKADIALRKDAMAYDTLALVLNSLGSTEAAQSTIETALKLDSSHPLIRRHRDAIVGGNTAPESISAK